MSAISSRPRVRRLSSSVVTAAGIGALVLAGRALREMLARMDADVATGLQEVRPDVGAPHEVRSLPQSCARYEAALREAAPATGAVTSMQTLKLSALAAIDAAAFTAPPEVCRTALQPLVVASTPAALADAQNQAVATLMHAHAQTMTEGLAAACATVSRTLGFERIEVRPAIIGNGVRVLALNADGRTLVSEVGPVAGGDIEVQTEVIGVTDGSCHALLDHFDVEMERLGVTADPTRRSTGGVCQLAAAREFVKRLPVRQPVVAPLPSAAEQSIARRTANRDATLNKVAGR